MDVKIIWHWRAVSIFAGVLVLAAGAWGLLCSWLQLNTWISALAGAAFASAYMRWVPLWHLEVRP